MLVHRRGHLSARPSLERSPRKFLQPTPTFLALDRHIDPRLRRMKVEMAWPKLHSVPRLDRREIRQHAALETVGLDRTRVHRVVARGIVATRNHDDLLIVRGCPDLMRVFAGV